MCPCAFSSSSTPLLEVFSKHYTRRGENTHCFQLVLKAACWMVKHLMLRRPHPRCTRLVQAPRAVSSQPWFFTLGVSAQLLAPKTGAHPDAEGNSSSSPGSEVLWPGRCLCGSSHGNAKSLRPALTPSTHRILPTFVQLHVVSGRSQLLLFSTANSLPPSQRQPSPTPLHSSSKPSGH